MAAGTDFEELDALQLVDPPPRAVRLRIGVGAAIVLLVVALVVAVVVSLYSPRGSSELVVGDSHTSTPSSTGATIDPGKAGDPLFVHVFGAVRNPGLFELSAGARLIDAVGAAGGFIEGADESAVNLARIVSDGEQIGVPLVGETLISGSASDSSADGGSSAGKVNVNSATPAELETLPKVGPATARRIVEWRTSHGRFATIEDLMGVGGIGQKTFDGLKDLITV